MSYNVEHIDKRSLAAFLKGKVCQHDYKNPGDDKHYFAMTWAAAKPISWEEMLELIESLGWPNCDCEMLSSLEHDILHMDGKECPSCLPMKRPKNIKKNEAYTRLKSGVYLVCEASEEGAPNPGTSYVRFVNSQGEELYYWDKAEWQEAPENVMGAIIGATIKFNND